MQSFDQFLKEQDDEPMSRSLALSKSEKALEGIPEDQTEMMFNLQRATYELVNNHPEDFKHMINVLVRSGRMDDRPEFKSKLEELAHLISSTKMKSAASRAAKRLEPNEGPIKKEKELSNMDDIVMPAIADKQGEI
jgi:hypothetical protein